MRQVQRVQQHRGKQLPPGVRSVARPSRWGNPFRVGPELTREQAVARYRTWLDERLAGDPAFLDPLRSASGLACYCPPDGPCHAEVLIERLRSM
jgi:hypothetical protein